MAENVFASYDSRIIHEKECKELDLSKRLIEFPSVEEAVASGALPCKSCQTDLSAQDLTPDEQEPPQDIHKTPTDAGNIIKWFIVPELQLISISGNIEKKSADFKVRLPKGFKETLTKLEVKYNDEWTAFNQHTDGCTVYYGWIRGNVIGEYKLKLCEDYQTDSISIDCISLTPHGAGGMAISRYKDTQKTDKKAFFSYDSIRLSLKGKDLWGPFSVQVVGEVFDSGKMMVGTWDTNHGAYGDYKGTFYGIRLDSVKTTSASITDQSLYQAMINFESPKPTPTPPQTTSHL